MRFHSFFVAASISFAAGCGGNNQAFMGEPDMAMAAPDLATAPAADMALPPIPDLPQVSRHAGKIIPNMNLVTIAWTNTTYAKMADDFGNMVFSSKWLQATGAEYGVKGGTHTKHVVINSPAPAKMTG